MLEARGLTKHFGGVKALTGFDMEIRPGEIVGLIGPNGAGKTTIFNLVTGMLRPTAGRIVFEGREISRLRPHAICRLGIARTYQNVRPFAELTAMENILVTITNRERDQRLLAEARDEARHWLAFVGLAEYAAIAAHHLNIFQRKKLELARALGARPRLLLLDELIAGLTPTEVDAAVALIQGLRDELRLSVLVIEHVMRAIMRLSDRIIVLHQGGKVREGLPAEIGADPEVQRIYLGDPHAGR